MFRRWSSAAAVAVAAACLLLCAQSASAQVRVVVGAGPVVNRPLYLSPSYIAPSYRTSFLYYQVGLPYNPMITNPFLYRDPVTPVAYGLTPGVVPGSLSSGGFAGFSAPAFGSFGYSGFSGYANYLPINFASYTGYGAGIYAIPSVNYAGYPSYAYPSFYPGGLPYFSATRTNIVGYADTLADIYGAGLTEVPYVPGLTATTTIYSGLPRMRSFTAATYTVPSPEKAGEEVLFDNSAGRVQAPLSPISTVRPAALAQEAGTEQDRKVRIEVNVPTAEAEVLFNGQKTTQTGKVREFVTPPLQPGTYSYQIRCRWTRDGQQAEEVQTVQIRPGQRRLVDFTTK